MVLDSSAIVAILLVEDDYSLFLKAVKGNPCRVGAPTVLEVAMVLAGRIQLENPQELLDGFLMMAEVEVVPFGYQHLSVARAAFVRYGKGRHPASLNLGDCLTYAVAKVAGEPLLFKGNDFSQTDLVAA